MKALWLRYLRDLGVFVALGALLVFAAVRAAELLDQAYGGEAPYGIRLALGTAFLGIALALYLKMTSRSYRNLKQGQSQDRGPPQD